ncbi:MAG: hypothetical protein KAJ91_00120 [Candidatus Aenigmarchaeota archaeon]|nr:hypothetical protein [Candidatus Aenigmarchaeota archaeon]MCK5334370.1 hypothetical protein [Candidatus Aenigmarchaeota archaeon]
MATRDTLIKVRRMIAEFKIYTNRTQTYLAPFQLFMIFLIFLNTTVWNVDLIQSFFESKTNFIIIGSIFFAICVLILGYMDTKLRILGVEQARFNTPDRNPFAPLFILWTALLLNNEKNNRKSLERKISATVKELGADKIYAEYKSDLIKPIHKKYSGRKRSTKNI